MRPLLTVLFSHLCFNVFLKKVPEDTAMLSFFRFASPMGETPSCLSFPFKTALVPFKIALRLKNNSSLLPCSGVIEITECCRMGTDTFYPEDNLSLSICKTPLMIRDHPCRDVTVEAMAT